MNVLIDPALVDDVGEEGVEQSQIRAGVDLQVQDVVLSGLHLRRH